jgi:hypothetical protein
VRTLSPLFLSTPFADKTIADLSHAIAAQEQRAADVYVCGIGLLFDPTTCLIQIATTTTSVMNPNSIPLGRDTASDTLNHNGLLTPFTMPSC